MQRRLVDSILHRPIPTSVNEVRQILGLANFYRRSIQGYAGLMQLVSDLVRTKSFCWGDAQAKAFEWLKDALTRAPVLAHASPDKTFVVCTDASKYAIAAALEQDGHPVAYMSHRLSDAKMKWDACDQELLAFMNALCEWRVYLRGRHFILRTDHEPLRYLQSKARLTGRQYG